MLGRLGTRIAVIEPAPVGLLRAARAPRTGTARLEAVPAVLPRREAGDRHGGRRAISRSSGTPSTCPGEEDGRDPGRLLDTLDAGAARRITVPIDTVVIHGRPDLTLTIDHESFRQRTGARLVRCASPDYDLASAALGVALNNPLTEATGHDLARDFKPAVPIRDIFPWAELVLQGALIGGVSLFLSGAAADVETRFGAAGPRLATFTWLKDQDQGKLDAEKKLLEERIKAIEAFQKTRVDWSTQLRTIAADVPETTIITSLTGDGEARGSRQGKPGKAKKQLVVNFVTPLAEDGAMPGEIDQFISALRDEPSILRHFPTSKSPACVPVQPRTARRKWPSTALSAFPRPSRSRAGTTQVSYDTPAVPVPVRPTTMSEKTSGSSLEKLGSDAAPRPDQATVCSRTSSFSPPGTSASTAP